MKIIYYCNDTGSRHWRGTDPAKYLRAQGYEAYVSDEMVTEKALAWADVIVTNSIVSKDAIALIREYQVLHGKKLVVDCDDYFDLNDDSPFLKEHTVSDAKEVIQITMGIADLITCTTTYLQSKLRLINPNVKVLPNMMDMGRWDLPKHFNTSNKIRIGWAGSITHLNDLKAIVKPLIRIKEEYPQVEYVFVGEPRIADEFPFPVEIIQGVPFEVWPARLSGLRLDIGLAPLLETPFNKAKSNIKFLEYAINKIPGVYSETVYMYSGFEPKFGLVAMNEDHWYRAIKHLIDYPERRDEIKESSYTRVKQSYDLEKHISLWTSTYKGLFPEKPFYLDTKLI